MCKNQINDVCLTKTFTIPGLGRLEPRNLYLRFVPEKNEIYCFTA